MSIPYLINSFRGGISDESNKGIVGAYKFGQNLSIHSSDDILMSNPTMYPVFGNSGSVISGCDSTTQTGIINYFVPASDGTIYCFGSTGSVFARNGDILDEENPTKGKWNFVYNDENGAIKGAAEWKLNDGVNYLMWATDTSIARKELQGVDIVPDSGSARWTDVNNNWKTTLDPADYHTMKNASGSLMIANGNNLASIAYDGTFNPAVLNIRPGNLIKCIDERDDYTILGSYRKDSSEEGYIWSWIPTALNWVQKKRIPVKGINCLINTEVMLLQGGTDGKLFYSDFTNAIPLCGILGGGQVEPGGVSILDGIAMFGVYGGTHTGIWSYGRKQKNRPSVLNFDYKLVQYQTSGSVVSTIAAVCAVNGVLYASWGITDGSTSEYGVNAVFSNYSEGIIYESLEFSAGKPYIKKIFNTVVVNMLPFTIDDPEISVKYKIDKEDNWRYAITGANSTSFWGIGATEAIFTIGKPANVYEVGIETRSNSGENLPKILSITTYFEWGNEYA
uniref:Uncharacterized protein n=1 Tax=viral metagenome TaxID=1070528 RepID=A0A6M3K913_9ZZZZ